MNGFGLMKKTPARPDMQSNLLHCVREEGSRLVTGLHGGFGARGHGDSAEALRLIRVEIDASQAPPQPGHRHGYADGEADQEDPEGVHDWSSLPGEVLDYLDDEGPEDDGEEGWPAERMAGEGRGDEHGSAFDESAHGSGLLHISHWLARIGLIGDSHADLGGHVELKGRPVALLPTLQQVDAIAGEQRRQVLAHEVVPLALSIKRPYFGRADDLVAHGAQPCRLGMEGGVVLVRQPRHRASDVDAHSGLQADMGGPFQRRTMSTRIQPISGEGTDHGKGIDCSHAQALRADSVADRGGASTDRASARNARTCIAFRSRNACANECTPGGSRSTGSRDGEVLDGVARCTAGSCRDASTARLNSCRSNASTARLTCSQKPGALTSGCSDIAHLLPCGLGQLGPDASPVIGAQVLPADLEARLAFDHNAQLGTRLPAVLPGRELMQIHGLDAALLGESGNAPPWEGRCEVTEIHGGLCKLRCLSQSIKHSQPLCNARSLPHMGKSAQERPIRRIRREKLRQLIKEFGGPKGLAIHSGTPDTHFTAIEKQRRDVGDDLATKLEEACEKPFGWMDYDESAGAAVTAPPSHEVDLRSAIHLFASLFHGATPFVSFTAQQSLSRLAHHPEEADEVAKQLEGLFSASALQARQPTVRTEGAEECEPRQFKVREMGPTTALGQTFQKPLKERARSEREDDSK